MIEAGQHSGPAPTSRASAQFRRADGVPDLIGSPPIYMWVPIRELGPLDLLEGKCRGLITHAAGAAAPGNTGDDGPAADA